MPSMSKEDVMKNNVAPLLAIAILIMANAAFGASIAPTALACVPTSLGPNASRTCTITLNQAAPTGGSSVTLSSSTAALKVPASVTVAAGATSATFSATTGTLSTSQSATVTATLSSVSKTAAISLVTTPITYVQGNYAEPQTPQTTVNVTFTAAQLAGDLNVVVVGWFDSTAVVSSVTDSRGNTYARAVG